MNNMNKKLIITIIIIFTSFVSISCDQNVGERQTKIKNE